MNIFIFGSGNIAYHLVKAFKKNDISLAGIHSRNEHEGKLIASKCNISWYQNIKSIPKNADVYLICVSDDAIASVANQLPKSLKKSKIIAHTSGSKTINETLSLCKHGGVFYPLQTFTKGKKMTYNTIPFCINGISKKSIKSLTELGYLISGSVQLVDDEQRKKLHLSAVIINNFVNHLIFLAQDLLQEENVDPNILQPLLLETLKKQSILGAYEAQTGPARRKDSLTLATHLDLLKRKKEYKAIYMTISKSIQKTYKIIK